MRKRIRASFAVLLSLAICGPSYGAVAYSAAGAVGYTLAQTVDIPSVACAACEVLIAGWVYRANNSAVIGTAPTWNSESFTSLADITLPSVDHRMQVYALRCTGTTTASILASLNVFKSTAAGYVKLTGAAASSFIGTVGTQTVGTWGSAPSRTVTDGDSNSIIVSFLGMDGWDVGYGDVSATTVTNGSGQTSRVDQNGVDTGNTVGAGRARLIISTHSGSTSETMSYSFSAGQPMYMHAAFAVKASGGGPSASGNMFLVSP